MNAEPPAVASAYMKAVSDFQRKHAKYLMRGKFVDEGGFIYRTSCQPAQNGQDARSPKNIVAKRYTADDRTSAVCVWNISEKPVSVEIDGIDGIGKPSAVFAPAGEKTEGPLAPDSIRLYVFR